MTSITPFSSVFIADFEQVNVSWEILFDKFKRIQYTSLLPFASIKSGILFS